MLFYMFKIFIKKSIKFEAITYDKIILNLLPAVS